jgi:hypothetical protein
MSATRIYIEMSDDIQATLADNEISIADILRQSDFQDEITYGSPPYRTDYGSRDKDIVTIILASSVAVFAVGSAISQVLATLHRKPYFVQYDELVELHDADGNIMLDEKGNPQFKLVKRHKFLEPRKENADREFEAKLSSKRGFVIRFSSSEQQMDK